VRARRKLDYGLGMVLEGADLVRAAIASGKLPIESPSPLDPSKITLPNGSPLPPSLATLLSWDSSWLETRGWFRTSPSFSWTPRTLGQIAGEPFEVATFSTCFVLSERCIFVVTNEPDALGEYPVVLIDDEQVPFLCVYMAGLDVFLGDLSGVQPITGNTYEDVARDPRFRSRMDHHGRKLMKGRISTDFPRDTLNPRPERRGRNPFGGAELVIPAVPAGEVPIDWDASRS
jgi:hypothetical protein